MKVVLLLALCVGVVLCRPGLKDLQQTQQDPVTAAPPYSTPKPTENWFKTLAKKLKIKLTSMGSVDNNPGVAVGVDGQTYHRLSFTFGDDKDYQVYVDHSLDKFSKDDAGTLGVGYESPLPYLGTLAVKGTQSFNSAGNGSLDWRVEFDNEAWLNQE